MGALYFSYQFLADFSKKSKIATNLENYAEKSKTGSQTVTVENAVLNSSNQKLVDPDLDFSKLHSVVKRVHFISVRRAQKLRTQRSNSRDSFGRLIGRPQPKLICHMLGLGT